MRSPLPPSPQTTHTTGAASGAALLRAPLGAILLTLALAACSDGGGSSPTDPGPPPTSNPNTASFTLESGGQSQTLSYDSVANTVFCSTNAGWASLWIRLGADPAANGENGPHIDMDLCNHDGGGSFRPVDPQAASCAGDKTFDLFWHGEGGVVYSNEPMAGNCMLTITPNGSRLSGTFTCRGLTEDGGGGGTVDVVNGSFDCAVTS